MKSDSRCLEVLQRVPGAEMGYRERYSEQSEFWKQNRIKPWSCIPTTRILRVETMMGAPITAQGYRCFIRTFSAMRMTQEVRRYLEDNGYIEIETPVLIDHPSGATARPFISHHNALDMDVYLRIAPETYLKRAIVGGFTKVFEFARCFRNEGMDATHLQDFTMLEGYCAYYNYRDNMKFLQDMLTTVVTKIWGTPEIEVNGSIINFASEWEVVTFRELILRDFDWIRL